MNYTASVVSVPYAALRFNGFVYFNSSKDIFSARPFHFCIKADIWSESNPGQPLKSHGCSGVHHQKWTSVLFDTINNGPSTVSPLVPPSPNPTPHFVLCHCLQHGLNQYKVLSYHVPHLYVGLRAPVIPQAPAQVPYRATLLLQIFLAWYLPFLSTEIH